MTIFEESLCFAGGFGTVFLATNTKGKQVAVKIMLSHDAAATKDIDNEIDMMKKLQHENIIQLFDASAESRSSNRSVKEYKISMEYCKCGLNFFCCKLTLKKYIVKVEYRKKSAILSEKRRKMAQTYRILCNLLLLIYYLLIR